jgi:putative redox protein
MSFKPLFESTRSRLREGSAPNPITVAVESENQGGFRSVVRLRDFTLTIDQPKGFGGTNQGPKPSEVLLAALAACQEITWRLYADALGISLDGIRVELSGVQDLRGFLGVDDRTRPGFQHITGTVVIDSPAPDHEIERLKHVVDRHCPVLDDLLQPTPVELAWRRA